MASTSDRDGIFGKELTVWHLVMKCTAVSCKALNVETHPSQREIPAMPVRQVLLVTPTGKQPRVHPRTRWHDKIPTWLGPMLVWS